ncbi:MAG: GIY-YIG nuclease family protein [Spirochaetaceae bacterium]|nr:GIY-YIG nuclease family protein [Spirochaetaceae bacterium]
MQEILKIGFENVGQWFIANGDINFTLNKFAEGNNILYAFIVNNEIKYIGKSTKTLAERMGQYRNPGTSQKTNIRNKQCIKDCLLKGNKVFIYVFVDSGMFSYGSFKINLSAGLEDSIINKCDPEWNIIK